MEPGSLSFWEAPIIRPCPRLDESRPRFHIRFSTVLTYTPKTLTCCLPFVFSDLVFNRTLVNSRKRFNIMTCEIWNMMNEFEMYKFYIKIFLVCIEYLMRYKEKLCIFFSGMQILAVCLATEDLCAVNLHDAQWSRQTNEDVSAFSVLPVFIPRREGGGEVGALRH